MAKITNRRAFWLLYSVPTDEGAELKGCRLLATAAKELLRGFGYPDGSVIHIIYKGRVIAVGVVRGNRLNYIENGTEIISERKQQPRRGKFLGAQLCPDGSE